MPRTKRQIVEGAFEEIGLASYDFDLQPQEMESALQRLDAMVATWNGKGIRLGYSLPSEPGNSDQDQDLSVPDAAVEALIYNLAIRLAPGYGKTVSPDTKMIAASAYNQLIAQSVKPVEMQINPDFVPAGAGNKTWRFVDDPFLRKPQETLDAGPDSILDLE